MKNSLDYPAFFARFYDTIYDHVRDATDHQYYMNKIKNAKGPVLEIGTGTGRFFIDALNNGADIYGIDISPEMIKILENKLPEKELHRVQVQDICTFKLEQRFDLIIAPFRVFMHLLSVEEQLKALERKRKPLHSSYSLILFQISSKCGSSAPLGMTLVRSSKLMMAKLSYMI